MEFRIRFKGLRSGDPQKAQRFLGILRKRYAIYSKSEFPDSAEHIYYKERQASNLLTANITGELSNKLEM